MEHMAEFRTLEECEHTAEHQSQYELELLEREKERQGPKTFQKLSGWKRSSSLHMDYLPEQTARVGEKRATRQQNEQRAARLLRTEGIGWDGGFTPAPRAIETVEFTGVSPRTMPSQDVQGKQGMRNCSRKLETAEFYSSQYHRKRRTGGGTRTVRPKQQVDTAALAALLEELGS